MVVNELLNLGLSQKEAEVYLANLQLGLATAQKIAEKAEINRTTAYATIKNLITRGLINTVDKAGKQYFVAEKPEKLKYFYEQQERELQRRKETIDKIMPELESLYNFTANRSFVKIIPRKDIDLARQELWSRKYQEVDSILNDYLINKFKYDGPKEEPEVMRKVLNNCEIFKKLIISEKKNFPYFSNYPDILAGFQRKYLSAAKYKLPHEIFVMDDRAVIAREEEFLFIDDEIVAHSFRLFFNLLWELAEDLP